MIGEYEHGSVVRRVIAPPACPRMVRPRPSNRPKHVAAKNPGSHIVEPARCKIIVDAGSAVVAAMHPTKRAGGKCPLVHGPASTTERVVEVLMGAGAKAVEGYGEAVDAEFSHRWFVVPEITVARVKCRPAGQAF